LRNWKLETGMDGWEMEYTLYFRQLMCAFPGRHHREEDSLAIY
jgi:hypothetical protein